MFGEIRERLEFKDDGLDEKWKQGQST